MPRAFSISTDCVTARAEVCSSLVPETKSRYVCERDPAQRIMRLVFGGRVTRELLRRWFQREGHNSFKQRNFQLLLPTAVGERRHNSTSLNRRAGDGVVLNRSYAFGKLTLPLCRSATMATSTSSEEKPRNRLASEKSPYLLQHASNPVNW